MSIAYTWRVIGLDGYPEQPGLPFKCMWDATGTDDSGKSEYIDGSVLIDSNLHWLPYNELTTQELVNWVHISIGQNGVKSYEKYIADKIASR